MPDGLLPNRPQALLTFAKTALQLTAAPGCSSLEKLAAHTVYIVGTIRTFQEYFASSSFSFQVHSHEIPCGRRKPQVSGHNSARVSLEAAVLTFGIT